MVSSDGLSRLYQKQYQYNPSDGTNVITLIDNKLSLIADKISSLDSSTWVNGFIKVFNCQSRIGPGSLPETPIPNFLDTDTQAETLTKQRDVLWNNPAYRLIVCLADPTPVGQSTVWVEKKFWNIQNNFGFPYTDDDLLSGLTTDIARGISEGGKLGIAFEDIGWGLPKPQDRITFDLVWQADYCWIKPFDVNISQPLVVQTATVQQVTQKNDSYTVRVGTTATQILAANTARLSGFIANGSTNTIYVGLNRTPTAAANDGAIAANATFPLPAGNKTSVSVLANTGATNTVTASEIYNVS